MIIDLERELLYKIYHFVKGQTIFVPDSQTIDKQAAHSTGRSELQTLNIRPLVSGSMTPFGPFGVTARKLVECVLGD